jgi:hypothetical protein
MMDFISRHYVNLWLAIIATNMVMTWLFGFDSQRGTWALILCLILFNIWCRLGEILDALDRFSGDE